MSVFVHAIGFGIASGSVLALAAVGMTLQFGISRILNLAYGDVMIVSAFAGYAVNAVGGGLAWSLAAGAVTGGIASILLNKLLLSRFLRRGTGSFGMVIVTLAIAVIIENVMLAVAGPNSSVYTVSVGSTIGIGPMSFSILQLAFIGLSVGVMVLIHVGLTRTRVGKAMRATASNPVLAGACGIRCERVVNLVWLVSGVLAGLGGVMLAVNTIAFNFSSGSAFLIVIVAVVILGGVGQVYGAMSAALIVGIVTSIAAAYTNPSFEYIAAYGVLVVVVLVRPSGLFGPRREPA